MARKWVKTIKDGKETFHYEEKSGRPSLVNEGTVAVGSRKFVLLGYSY